MSICIIILNYNDSGTVERLVDSIIEYEMLNRIIIVDNCSTDDSYVKLYTKYQGCDKVSVILTDKNGGYGYGNNVGIKYAIDYYGAKYIIISNPDVKFEQDVILEMLSVYEKCNDRKIGVVAPVMCDYSGNPSFNCAWKLPDFLDDIVLSLMITQKLFARRLYYKNCFTDAGYVFVDVLPGSFFMITADAIKDVGYFDEDVFLYCEERILAFKLKQRGYKNVLIRTKKYIHHHSKTISKNIKNELKRYLILQKSRRIYNEKYLNINCIKKVVFDIITWVGVIEKAMYLLYKKLFRNNFLYND